MAFPEPFFARRRIGLHGPDTAALLLSSCAELHAANRMAILAILALLSSGLPSDGGARAATSPVGLERGHVEIGQLGETEPVADDSPAWSDVISEDAERIVREAQHVQVIRLKTRSGLGFATELARKGERALEGFAVAYDAQVSDPTLIANLKAMLVRPGSGEPYYGVKLCGGFQPKVVFRFLDPQRPGRTVDVYVCFNCDDLGVPRPVPDEPGETYFAMADFSESRAAWLELSRLALPHDEELKKIRD